jgi:hypothetical protein
MIYRLYEDEYGDIIVSKNELIDPRFVKIGEVRANSTLEALEKAGRLLIHVDY